MRSRLKLLLVVGFIILVTGCSKEDMHYLSVIEESLSDVSFEEGVVVELENTTEDTRVVLRGVMLFENKIDFNGSVSLFTKNEEGEYRTPSTSRAKYSVIPTTFDSEINDYQVIHYKKDGNMQSVVVPEYNTFFSLEEVFEYLEPLEVVDKEKEDKIVKTGVALVDAEKVGLIDGGYLKADVESFEDTWEVNMELNQEGDVVEKIVFINGGLSMTFDLTKDVKTVEEAVEEEVASSNE